MEKTKVGAGQLTRIALIAAVLCIIGPLSIPIPGSPVPISLTHLGIYLGIYTLGAKGAAIATMVYLMVGAAGLPVFSNYGSGLVKLAGPTGGYLFGFVLMAWIAGRFIDRQEGIATGATGLLLGNLVCYLLGTAWLSWQAELSLWATFLIGVIPYVPFDILKGGLALWAGPKIRRAVGRESGR